MAIKYRFLLDYKASLRKVFQITFTKKDASFYIFPYGDNHFWGRQYFKKNETKKDVNFKKQCSSQFIPKLSYHESGEIYVELSTKEQRIGPIQAAPLLDLRGQHIATVQLDSFEGLPRYEDSETKKENVILPTGNLENGHFAIYASAAEKKFDDPCPIQIDIERSYYAEALNRNCNYRLHIGIAPSPQDIMPRVKQGFNSGITVIAGWDNRKPINASSDFIYIRAES